MQNRAFEKIRHEIDDIVSGARRPGAGLASDASEIDTAPNSRSAVFAGTILDELNSSPCTHIFHVEFETRVVSALTSGAHSDRSPKFSPDGLTVAFISDRDGKGDWQLFFYDLETGVSRAANEVDGWVEYFHWSMDGENILLGVAGRGADMPSIHGATGSTKPHLAAQDWEPDVDDGDKSFMWRSVWILSLSSLEPTKLDIGDQNIWEANWCGADAIVGIVSTGPLESDWYNARLEFISLNGSHFPVFTPPAQLGNPVATSEGDTIAVISATCSDRLLIAGDLIIINDHGNVIHRADTQSIDVSNIAPLAGGKLLVSGYRSHQTVVGIFDIAEDKFYEIWGSQDLSLGGVAGGPSAISNKGDFVCIAEGFFLAPEIALVSEGNYRTITSFDLLGTRTFSPGQAETVSWKARDHTQIEGWLIRPEGTAPYPTIMSIHGGPIAHARPRWLGRSAPHFLALLTRGFCIFFPNPRGSSGRGQTFARLVIGDMGGEDARDCLSGLDHLVSSGIADGSRLGVMGISYGGFLTSSLVTQDDRFKAAVSIAPMTNFITQKILSNIPAFVKIFLGSDSLSFDEKYLERSPIFRAGRVSTPIMNICGARDRCTPPEEAAQFHRLLIQAGKDSRLITYPKEGHGIKGYPALLDHSSRIVEWFIHHLEETVRRDNV